MRQAEAERTGKLAEEHCKIPVEYIDEHSAAVLSDIRLQGVSWTDNRSQHYIRQLVQRCKVTVKKLKKLIAARNFDRVVAVGKEDIEEWKSTPGLDFSKIVCSST